MGKDCAVVTSHTQRSFYQITSFAVGNRKKGRNASCFIVLRLKPNTDFQLSNERKAHWRRKSGGCSCPKYVVHVGISHLEGRWNLQSRMVTFPIWALGLEKLLTKLIFDKFLSIAIWTCSISHHFTKQPRVCNVI